jgi:hypothetical protein
MQKAKNILFVNEKGPNTKAYLISSPNQDQCQAIGQAASAEEAVKLATGEVWTYDHLSKNVQRAEYLDDYDMYTDPDTLMPLLLAHGWAFNVNDPKHLIDKRDLDNVKQYGFGKYTQMVKNDEVDRPWIK